MDEPNKMLRPKGYNTTIFHGSGDYYHQLDTGGTSLPMESNASTNVTYPPIPVFNEMSTIKVVVLSVMFLISFIGNCATLVQMVRMRRRKSTINTLILHLVTADLVVTFFCNISDAVWAVTVQWYGGNGLCKIVKFLQVFGLYLSTYIIVIIAIDRCYAILDPMSRNKGPGRVRTMIVIAWILSALFSCPQAYIFRTQRGPFEEDFYQCVTFGAYTANWQRKLYSCLTVTLMFLIPLGTMITAYMLIFCTIAKKSRDLQREEDTTQTDMLGRAPVRNQLFRKAKVKSLRMTTLIVVAFIVCWTPYYVVYIIHTFYDVEEMPQTPLIWIFFFGMANSMVNPMIYGAFHICKKRRRARTAAQRNNCLQLARRFNTVPKVKIVKKTPAGNNRSVPTSTTRVRKASDLAQKQDFIHPNPTPQGGSTSDNRSTSTSPMSQKQLIVHMSYPRYISH